MKSWMLYAMIFSIFFGVVGFVVNVLSNFYIFSHLFSTVIFSGFLIVGVVVSVSVKVLDDESEEPLNQIEPKYFRQAINQGET